MTIREWLQANDLRLTPVGQPDGLAGRHGRDMKHVPTAAELVNLGLARVRYDLDSAGRKHLFHIISDEGHAMMGAAMRENALEARAAGAADWVRPPSRVIPGLAESPWQNAPLPGETS